MRPGRCERRSSVSRTTREAVAREVAAVGLPGEYAKKLVRAA